MSIFRARYAGTCSKCKKAITTGQYISWVRGKRGMTYHADCAAPDAIPEEPVRSKRDDELEALRETVSRLEHSMSVTSAVLIPHGEIAAPSSTPYLEGDFEKFGISSTPYFDSIAVFDAAISKIVEPKTDTIKPKPSVTARAMKSCRLTVASHWLEVFGAILPHVRRVLLIGAPGTGKSTAAMNVAGCKYRVTMTESTTKDDLLGYWELRDQKTVWVDGPVTLAMREGAPILIDEINCYSPEASSLLYSIIDDAPHVEIPSGTIEAKDGYKMIMTANEGLDTLPDAVRDRIEVVLDANIPCEGALSHITPALAECCAAYYRTLPKPVISLLPSVRRVRTLHTLLQAGIDSTLAAKLVFGEASAEISSVLASIASERGE